MKTNIIGDTLSKEKRLNRGSSMLASAIIVALALIVCVLVMKEDGKVYVGGNENYNLQAEMDAEFVSGCVDGDYEYLDYCNCTIKEIHKIMTIDEFIEDSLEYVETGYLSEDFMTAVNNCSYLY